MPIFYAINQNPYAVKESGQNIGFTNNFIHTFGG